MKSIVLLLIVCLAVSGCASFDSVTYDDRVRYRPTDPEFVKVFSNTPPRNFVKIGEVSAKGMNISSRTNMIRRLKEDAAAMGGDAIILNTEEVVQGTSGRGRETDDGYFSVNTDINRYPVMSGIVIKFAR